VRWRRGSFSVYLGNGWTKDMLVELVERVRRIKRNLPSVEDEISDLMFQSDRYLARYLLPWASRESSQILWKPPRGLSGGCEFATTTNPSAFEGAVGHPRSPRPRTTVKKSSLPEAPFAAALVRRALTRS
jgi:hypothetical protein